MKEFLVGLLLYSTFCVSYAQTVRVVDKELRQGINNVSVYSNDRKVFQQTSPEGHVDFSPFQNSDTLRFQHPAYQGKAVAVEELKRLGYQVPLREKVIQIEEAVVMVNRWEQDKNEIPQEIVSVSPAQIAFQNPQTAADVLESTGEVFVQKSQLGGGSPMIRGFAANSVLIVVDGVRMNNAIFRSGNLQNVISIDPATIGEAEVVFGPGSVIYGSDALGGVMDFHTKQPRFSYTGKTAWSANAFTRYASANHEKTGHVDVSFGSRRWSTLTSFTYSDFDDLRTGSQRTEKYPDFGKRFNYVVRSNGEDSIAVNKNVNVQVPSGYSQLNLMQKLSFRPTELTELTYGFIYSTTSDIPRYDRLIVYDEATGLPEDAEWYYGPQQWMMHYLKARLYAPRPLYDEMKVTLAYQALEESRNDRGFGSPRLRSRTENVNAYTLNADADKVLNDENHLFYGIELVHNDVASQAKRTDLTTGKATPTSTRYPDGGSDYNAAAAYVSHQWNFRPEFTLNTGLRYSHIWLTSRFADKKFYDFPFDEINVNTGALSGSAGLVYRPNPNWKLSGMLSSGFRAPNVDDVGKVFDSEPGSVVVPNPGLGPEYSYNAEISLTKTWADKIQLGSTVFYSLLRDAMVRRDFTFNGRDSIVYDGTLSKVQALVNVGRAYIVGFSLDALAAFSDAWTFRSTLSYNTGRDTDEQIPLRHTTPLFGRTSVTYQNMRFRGEVYAQYNGARTYAQLPPSERNKTYLYTPDGALAWYTLNLKTSYGINDYLKVFAGLENILDKHYRPYSSGISAPGRNLIFTVRVDV